MEFRGGTLQMSICKQPVLGQRREKDKSTELCAMLHHAAPHCTTLRHATPRSARRAPARRPAPRHQPASTNRPAPSSPPPFHPPVPATRDSTGTGTGTEAQGAGTTAQHRRHSTDRHMHRPDRWSCTGTVWHSEQLCQGCVKDQLEKLCTARAEDVFHISHQCIEIPPIRLMTTYHHAITEWQHHPRT